MTDALPLSLVPAASALARSAGFVTAGSWPLLPGSCLRVRLAAVLALAAVCLPQAITGRSTVLPTDPGGATLPGVLVVILQEGLLGAALGCSVAAVSAAASWAVSIAQAALGDDGSPTESGPEEDPLDPLVGSAGALGRLAFWMSTAAFFTAGGERWVVGGLVASYRTLPPGLWQDSDLGALTGALAASSFGIAVSLAIPLLAAVVTFRLATAIVLRTARLSPGHGLLRAASMLVMLAALWLATDLLAARLGHALEGPIERAVGGVVRPPDVTPEPARE